MIFEFDSNRGLFVGRSKGPKKRLAEAVDRPKLAFAVSPKYLSDETKIYIFITRIPRVVYIIFWGFSKNFIFISSGRYLQACSREQFFFFFFFFLLFLTEQKIFQFIHSAWLHPRAWVQITDERFTFGKTTWLLRFGWEPRRPGLSWCCSVLDSTSHPFF